MWKFGVCVKIIPFPARQCALTNVRGIVNCERHCELCAALCAHNCVNVEEVISVEEVMSQLTNSQSLTKVGIELLGQLEKEKK